MNPGGNNSKIPIAQKMVLGMFPIPTGIKPTLQKGPSQLEKTKVWNLFQFPGNSLSKN